MPFLRPDQLDAVKRMKKGCILNGGVGSGKSRVSLQYYCNQFGGGFIDGKIRKLVNPCDLYIITTASKRDRKEWDEEMRPFCIRDQVNVVVDSWQNICKYQLVSGAFFIFDEDKVTGRGKWVQAFYKIAKQNHWIILSATPGDTWSDYIPVFIANGFYRNRTEFVNRHVIYSRFTKYPKVDRYIETKTLYKLRESILVGINFQRNTVPHVKYNAVDYDPVIYKSILKNRVNPETKEPIQTPAEYCFALRKVVNSDPSRAEQLLEIRKEHPRTIVFYNYDYELDILRAIDYGPDVTVAEYNGHKHEPVPTTDKWVYLVNYGSGAEAWNCTATDTIVFYSSSYSYRVMIQAMGRIDRSNTPYVDLYYYILRSCASIDIAIARALATKKQFNESKFTQLNVGAQILTMPVAKAKAA